MRVLSVLPIALALAPTIISAAGNLGFAIGDRKPDGTCKSAEDFELDLDAIKDRSTLIRTYSAAQCDSAKKLLPACKKRGFKVIVGVWPDTDESFNNDTAALQSAVPGFEEQIFGITVGSETLYRRNFTGEQLLSKINDVQSLFPTLLIGTADSWNRYADGDADALVTGGVKLFLVNAFAYWQGQDINNATNTYFDDIQQATGRIQELANCIDCVKIINGETGWPTDGGSNYEDAIAGTANAQRFFKEGVCAMLTWGVDVYYFEAFDEPNKPVTIGDNNEEKNEQHWGAYTVDRKAKFDLSC